MPFPVYSRKYESECHSQPITKSAELRDLQGSIGYQGHSCPITLAYGIPRFPPPFFSLYLLWMGTSGQDQISLDNGGHSGPRDSGQYWKDSPATTGIPY